MHLEFARSSLERQLRATLLTLRDLAERYPDDLWLDPGPETTAWQLAYHTLFFGDYYLAPASDQHDHWPVHRRGVQYEDGIPGPPIEGDARPLVCRPYSRGEAIAFCDHILGRLSTALAALDLDAPECGFEWYPIPKFEHLLVNLRHLQHGAAQLADRLRAATGQGTPWLGSR